MNDNIKEDTKAIPKFFRHLKKYKKALYENHDPVIAFENLKAAHDIGFPEDAKRWCVWDHEFFWEHCKGGAKFGFRIGYTGPGGVGKVATNSTKIRTPTGWTTHGEVKVGDKVCHPNGGESTVIQLHPHPNHQFYKVTFRDGTSIEVGAEHIWKVKSEWQLNPKKKKDGTKKNSGFHLYNTKTLIEKGVVRDIGPRNPKGKYKWYIPVTEPVLGKEKKLSFDPYTLGVFLGDGCITGNQSPSLTLNEKDSDILEKIPYKYQSYLQKNKHCLGVNFSLDFNDKFFDLGLLGTYSDTKFIPKEYLFASVEQRTALLQGLNDTDGHCTKPGIVEYSTSSKQLAEDYADLARSLGGYVTISDRIPTYTHKGEKLEGKRNYRIYTRLPESIQAFHTVRKLAKYNQPNQVRNIKWKAIVSIEKVEEKKDGHCITVDNEDGLYVAEDYIVTHNSHRVGKLAILNWLSNPTKNRVIATSTTLKGSKSRIWGHICHHVDQICKQLPYIKVEFGDRRQSIHWAGTRHSSPIHGIHLVASARGKEENIINDLIGAHPDDIYLLVLDEANSLNIGFLTVLENAQQGSKYVQSIAIGNANSTSDLHGVLCTPIIGFPHADFLKHSVYDTRDGIVLHCSPYKSPVDHHPDMRVREFYRKKKFVCLEKLEDRKAKLGEFSTAFRSQLLGLWNDDGTDNVMISTTKFAKNKVFRKPQWGLINPTVIASCDPSFTSGGDTSPIYFAEVGFDLAGYAIINFVDYVNIQTTIDGDDVIFQLAERIRHECEKRGVKPEHFILDTLNTGAGLAAILAQKWSPNFVRFEGRKGASETLVPGTQAMAKEIYNNAITEAYFFVRSCVEFQCFCNFPTRAAQQFSIRLSEFKENGKSAMESKKLLSKRLKVMPNVDFRSPDDADAVAMLCMLAKLSLGFVPQTAEQAAARKYEWEMSPYKKFAEQHEAGLQRMFNAPTPVRRSRRVVSSYGVSKKTKVKSYKVKG